MTSPTPPRPLEGVRVLDLSRVLAGPWAAQLLADYGADVIKVERPGAGDDTRAWGPPWWDQDGQRVGVYFLCANRGKRSVAIDIASPEGIAQVKSLAMEADVVIENYKVGQLAKYGLDAASLQALNPRLIYCSVTGYGQDGPMAHKAGYDMAVQAEGGLMSITGDPAGEPQKVGVAITDLMTGLYASTAILAALHVRHPPGRGGVSAACLFEVLGAMLANQACNALVGGMRPTRMGNAHPTIVPYGVFPTRDGHLVLAIGNDGQFARFCEVAGKSAFAQDARYATNPARVVNREALLPLVSDWTRERTTAEWVDLLGPAAVPASPILEVAEVMEHPQVAARGMVVPADPAHGRPPLVAQPMRFDGQRPGSSVPPPALGSTPGAQWKPAA